jgi:hypothetical protein
MTAPPHPNLYSLSSLLRLLFGSYTVAFALQKATKGQMTPSVSLGPRKDDPKIS